MNRDGSNSAMSKGGFSPAIMLAIASPVAGAFRIPQQLWPGKIMHLSDLGTILVVNSIHNYKMGKRHNILLQLQDYKIE